MEVLKPEAIFSYMNFFLLNISYISALLESLAAVVIIILKLFCHLWRNMHKNYRILSSKQCPSSVV